MSTQRNSIVKIKSHVDETCNEQLRFQAYHAWYIKTTDGCCEVCEWATRSRHFVVGEKEIETMEKLQLLERKEMGSGMNLFRFF